MNYTPKQLEQLIALQLASPMRQPALLVEGMPGIGKTAIVGQAIKKALPNAVPYWPPVASLLAFEGAGAVALPGPDEDRCRRVPVGEFASVLLDSSPERPAVLVLDELRQAEEDVQKSLMRWLIQSADLPPYVHVIGMTNGRTHRAGVRSPLSTVDTRVRKVTLVPCVDHWVRWALDQDYIPGDMIGYMRWSAVTHRDGVVWSSLCAPEVPATDDKYPTPRGWDAAARAVTFMGQLPEDLLTGAIAGDVGEAEAIGYMAFRSMYQDVRSVDSVLQAPATAPLPNREKPALAAGLICGCVQRLQQSPASGGVAAVSTYLGRMADEGWIEYAGYALRLMQEDPRLQHLLCNEKPGQRLLSDPKIVAIGSGAEVD